MTRPHLSDYMASAEEICWRAADLFSAFAAGKVQAAIHDVLPLERASDAHRIIEGRKTRGKLLLSVS